MSDLKQLRVLQTVGETGSFSAAADKLDYTQPAVSKIVACLERDYRTTLVDRGIRPLRLTDAGVAITRRAETALAELAAGEAEIEAIRRLEGGTLRLATFSSAGTGFVIEALRRFRKEHSEIDVTLAERSMPSTAVREMAAGDFDLVVVFDHPDAGDLAGEDLQMIPLLDDPWDLIVPEGHRLAKKRSVSFKDLASEDWLLPDFGPTSPSLRLINRGCGSAGFEPNIVFRINDCHMTQSMVAAGEGIALQPRLMLRPPHPGIAIKPLGAEAPIRRIVAVQHPSRFETPATKRFLELLAESAATVDAPI